MQGWIDVNLGRTAVGTRRIGATVAIIIIVGAIGLALYASQPKSPVKTSTSSSISAVTITTPVSSTAGLDSSLSSLLGLRLSLNVSANSNGSVTVVTEELNTLDRANNVTEESFWPAGEANLSLWTGTECGSTLPIGFEILQGNYGENNFTKGIPLSLEAEVFPPGCAVYGGSDYLAFMPLSDRVGSNTISISGTWSGSWTGSGNLGRGNTCPGSNSSYNCPLTLNPFALGPYTVVAGDEWGQVAILHFIVQTDSARD